MDIVLYALTAFLYGGLAVAGWRAHRHTAVEPVLAGVPSGIAAAPAARSRASGMSGVGRALLLIALLVHGVLLHMTIFPQNAMIFGFAFALSAMFWLGAGIYWIESFFFPLDGLRLLEATWPEGALRSRPSFGTSSLKRPVERSICRRCFASSS